MRLYRWKLLLAVVLALWLVGFPVLADEPGTAILGETVTLEAGEVQHGDLVLFGGQVHMLPGSRVEGDLAVVGGSADVAGEVTGSVAVLGGTLSLQRGAFVHGDAVVAGTLRYRDPDAVVQGNVVQGLNSAADISLPRVLPRWLSPRVGSGSFSAQATASPSSRGSGRFAMLVLTLLAALIAMVTVPSSVRNTRHVMTSSMGLSVGVGLLTALVAAVLIPVMVAICIGIPVAAVLTLGLFLSGALGWAAVGHIVGEKACGWLKVQTNPTAQAVLGVLIIDLLSWIPGLGALATVLAASWGLGAVVLTRFGTRVDPIWSGSARNPQPRLPQEPGPTIDAMSTGEPDRESGGRRATHRLDDHFLEDLESDAHDQLDSL